MGATNRAAGQTGGARNDGPLTQGPNPGRTTTNTAPPARMEYARAPSGRTEASGNNRLPIGFRPQNPETVQRVRGFSRRNPALMVAFALFYWANIASVAMLHDWLIQHLGPLIAGCVYLPSILWIARSMRAFECMVHEFGHGVFSKRRRYLDDTVGNLLVAWPMFTSIDAMRTGHNDPHHVHLGVAGIDPDLRRYDQLDAHDLDRSRWGNYAWAVAKRLPRYVTNWIRLTTRPSTVAASVVWLFLLVWLPLYAHHQHVGAAFLMFVLYWAIPYFCVLPVIRFVGETGKHVYFGGRTVAAITVSNIGLLQKLLVHPFGDGHHTLHHIFAHVPGYNMGRLHRWLMKNEPAYRQAIRYRLKVLEAPRSEN